MKNILCILLFLLFKSYNVYGQSQLAQTEYDCLKELTKLTGVVFDTFQGSDIIDFCKYDWVLTCSGSVVTKLNEWPMVNNGAYGLTTSTFSCFSSLKDIKLLYAQVSNDFLYSGGFSYLNTLELVSPNITSISQNISPLKSLKITFSSSLSILDLKYLKNVESFSSTTSVGTYYNDLSELNSNLKNLEINTNTLPNLSNFHSIERISVTGDYGFDLTSLNNNIGYQQGSFSLTILESSGTIPCTDFPSAQISQNQLLRDISFTNVCFKKVNSYIDISNSKIKSLYISSPSLDFNYIEGFPFQRLHFGSLYIEHAKFNSFDLSTNIFSNITSLSLVDCQIHNQFISKSISLFPNLNSIKVDNNTIQGSIDNSWCTTSLSVSNNSFTNSLPPCFSCYLNDSNIYNLFKGNSFTNFNSETTCELGVIVPTIGLVSKNGSILITGQNLPLLDSQIKSAPPVVWSTLVKSKSFSGTLANIQSYKTIDLAFINKYTFTLSLVNQPPIISTINHNPNNQEFTINGSYFTYNSSIVKFIIENTECQVKSSTFYTIVCSISSSIIQSTNYASLTIEPYLTQRLLIGGVNSVNVGCGTSCLNGMCDMVHGTCIYCFVDVDCNGGICGIDGICKCPIESTGDNCSIPNHYVTDIVASSELGGLVILNGYYGEIHDNPTVTIGSENCNIISINKTTIECQIGPGNGIKSINVTQNNIIYIGADLYKYQVLIKECPNKCSSNGNCSTDTGYCNCFEGFGKYDCSIKLGSSQNETLVKVNETGTTVINNQEIQYEILFLSINEINIQGESIKEYPLLGKWVYNGTLSNDSISVFGHVINDTIILASTIEQVKETKQFSFADINFTVERGGVKATISISNWVYQSSLNTLQVRMKSSIDQIKSTECDTDTLVNTIDDYDSINYMTISKNGKILYSRILDRVLSNQKPTFSKVSLVEKQSNSIIIALNLGHCSSCVIDPDFSLLIDSNISNSNCKNRRKWLIPVAVIVPVVSLSILFIVFYILYKKNKFIIKSKLKELKLKQIK